ncbi:ankyrin repeat-containing protein [Colletotrichum tofieldiae]|uniref:Ankyrin repeat-containing protein n=1 Tax=Colletotrichum tofieldiae TaxID=708197 RepID=A0A166W3M3_9PEZI|nr:ankyrin repeat-containing protein [Colletotrichum tofieldiae]
MGNSSALLAAIALTLVAALLVLPFFQQPAQQQPTKRRLSLRVEDIPPDEHDRVERILQETVQNDAVLRHAVTAPVLRSLGHNGPRSLCATITLRTSLSLDDLVTRLRQSGVNSPYNYNYNFEGITPLHDDSESVDVDIIAVPGLGSHALGSWRAPDGDDVWLRDFLPRNIPNIRVLLYGYNTMLPSSRSKQSIEDLGGTLLEQIIAFRTRDGTSLRPIVFIGHSLGGLLIKEALVRAHRKPNDASSQFLQTCYGLIFFGVPNLGLRNEQLITLVRGQPNEPLVNDLLVDDDSEPSAFLKRLGDQFSELCEGHCRVVNFYECRLSPTIQLTQSGQWQKTGPPSLLVTRNSATCTGLVVMAKEDNIPLDTDHSGLVKYQSISQGFYLVVADRIGRLVDETKKEVTGRKSARRNPRRMDINERRGQTSRRHRSPRQTRPPRVSSPESSSRTLHIKDVKAGNGGYQILIPQGNTPIHAEGWTAGHNAVQAFGQVDGLIAQLEKIRNRDAELRGEEVEGEVISVSVSQMGTG